MELLAVHPLHAWEVAISHEQAILHGSRGDDLRAYVGLLWSASQTFCKTGLLSRNLIYAKIIGIHSK